ncbi:MAG TPA: primosomal protein N' [Candidatus Limnocylindrales bacterium]|nr:primosomal protein N' [Candidatus Limnocylindrales bacterium]
MADATAAPLELGLGEAVPVERVGGLVEIAVDAPGAAGATPYTYRLPARLRDVRPGEAVIVPYGRRQALGIVLGPAAPPPDGRPIREVADLVRADGPLLPPLALALARWVSEHYLAPPVATIRSFLPPGLLERLELVAERRPLGADGETIGGGGQPDAGDGAILDQLGRGPRRVRDLESAEGRPAVLRRLRALAAAGIVDLDWTLVGASAGPRYERWVSGAPSPAAAPARLGPRQRAALEELAAAGGPVRAAELAGRHGQATVASLARRGLVDVAVRERPRRPLATRAPGPRGARPPGAALTPEQADAVRVAREAIARRDPTPLLLDGIAGAGKTAVYVEAIAASLADGRPALVLVPEIALATPLVDRLRADLSVELAVVHSGLGAGERADEWRRIRAGAVDVVVGTRAALGVPLDDVGLVVVDEEHEAAYKSDRTPRVQARDAAIRLAELAGAAVVLGSATPAVDSVGHARDGAYRRVVLPSRPAGALPPAVELVDLRAELAAGNRGLISARLATALAALDLDGGERAILVINRRGSASVVLCRDCGHVQACPECGRPLVFHQAGYTLRCHHCGSAAPLAARCPACRSPRIRYLGGGTERLEREIRDRFPGLRVGRLDRDVAERRGAADRVLDAFAAGRLDVLVGTSLVAKGLDVPEVALVGVVSADVALNLPDERAAERTYQLLVQAIGRAGRRTSARPGLGIVQTYQPDHPAIRAVVDGDRDAFYDAELDLRRAFGSPPFGRLVKLTVALPEREAAERAAREMADELRRRAEASASAGEPPVRVIGPAPAFVARRAGRWRFHLVLRGTDPVALLDPIPVPPWSVDVDPESLL